MIVDLLSGKHGRRKDFLLEGCEADFCRGSQKYFCSGAQSGCILFYSLKNKNTTIFCLKFNRKMCNFKIQGAKSPPSEAHGGNAHKIHNAMQHLGRHL